MNGFVKLCNLCQTYYKEWCFTLSTKIIAAICQLFHETHASTNANQKLFLKLCVLCLKTWILILLTLICTLCLSWLYKTTCSLPSDMDASGTILSVNCYKLLQIHFDWGWNLTNNGFGVIHTVFVNIKCSV